MKEWGLGTLPASSTTRPLITPLNICHIPENFKSDHVEARYCESNFYKSNLGMSDAFSHPHPLRPKLDPCLPHFPLPTIGPKLNRDNSLRKKGSKFFPVMENLTQFITCWILHTSLDTTNTIVNIYMFANMWILDSVGQISCNPKSKKG